MYKNPWDSKLHRITTERQPQTTAPRVRSCGHRRKQFLEFSPLLVSFTLPDGCSVIGSSIRLWIRYQSWLDCKQPFGQRGGRGEFERRFNSRLTARIGSWELSPFIRDTSPGLRRLSPIHALSGHSDWISDASAWWKKTDWNRRRRAFRSSAKTNSVNGSLWPWKTSRTLRCAVYFDETNVFLSLRNASNWEIFLEFLRKFKGNVEWQDFTSSMQRAHNFHRSRFCLRGWYAVSRESAGI